MLWCIIFGSDYTVLISFFEVFDWICNSKYYMGHSELKSRKQYRKHLFMYLQVNSVFCALFSFSAAEISMSAPVPMGLFHRQLRSQGASISERVCSFLKFHNSLLCSGHLNECKPGKRTSVSAFYKSGQPYVFFISVPFWLCDQR